MYKISVDVDSQLAIIESWLTSLKKHTIDYNENTFLNVKRIPSRNTSWCGSAVNDKMGINNNNSNNSNDDNNNNNLSVVNYRKNVQLIKDNVTSKRLCKFFNIFVSDNRSCTNRDKNSYHLMKNEHVNNNNNYNLLVLLNQNNNKKIDLKIILYHLCLSISLNQIVISYDDKLKFLVNNSAKYNIKGPKSLVKKYFQLLRLIDANNNNDNNNHKKINYFIKQYTVENYSLNYKKNILDYEIKCINVNNVTDARTIDDFVFKTNHSDYLKMKKNFSDFCLTADESGNKIEMLENKSIIKTDCVDARGDNRILRRDTVTKNRIKNLNGYRNAMGHHSQDDEYNIYQPIWKFQTIGNLPDDDHPDVITQANLAIPDDVSDSDNWSNADQDFAFQNFTFIDDTSFEYIDANICNNDLIINDSNNNNNNIYDQKIISSPYSKVTIYYKVDNNLINESNYCTSNDNRINTNQQINNCKNTNKLLNKYHNTNTNNYNKTIKNILKGNLPKNIENWQLNLLNYNLIEDEEDVVEEIMNEEKGPSFTETKIFGFANSKSISNTEKIAGNDSPPGKFTPNKFPDELEYNYGSFKNDVESENTSVKSADVSLKESPKYSPTNSEKKIERLKVIERSRKKEKDKVFGVELDKVELDPELGVPKFIVECIKIVEEDENLETNGIYRASGNKNNIENIKKKMNEKRFISKESKYTYLQNQDLHTITGALKLFFRETSDLIPEEVFANLPKNLGSKENLETVKMQINNLDGIRLETLKYLIKHLRKVHENNSKNLMTSSNLSIIWGASLFTKSVNSIMSLIENDIMNRNVLIRVLIDNYDYVFNENLFNSDSLSSNISSNDSSNAVNQR